MIFLVVSLLNYILASLVSLLLFIVGTVFIVIFFYRQNVQKKILAFGVTLLTFSFVILTVTIAIYLKNLSATLDLIGE